MSEQPPRARKMDAAKLVAQEWKAAHICRKVGISPGTLVRWKRLKDFQQAVTFARKQYDKTHILRSTYEQFKPLPKPVDDGQPPPDGVSLADTVRSEVTDARADTGREPAAGAAEGPREVAPLQAGDGDGASPEQDPDEPAALGGDRGGSGRAIGPDGGASTPRGTERDGADDVGDAGSRRAGPADPSDGARAPGVGVRVEAVDV